MIVIIDYGMGNLASVYNAFRKVGKDRVEVTNLPEKIEQADKLVLPGVGAFEEAMKNLQRFGLIEPIKNTVKKGNYLLGICLGFQLLFERSYEGGCFEGLGLLEGDVVRFNVELPVPHMGWNEAEFTGTCKIFDGLGKKVYFYFDHAYYPQPKDDSIVVAWTEYGLRFPSAVYKDSIYGVQFHPEKSHKNGLKIIQNFSAL